MLTTTIPPMSGLAAHAVHERGRRLFMAGMAGAHLGGIPCLALFALLGGRLGFLSAAMAFAMVLIFYGVGQWLVFRFSSDDPRRLFVVALCSFFGRCVAIGAGMNFLVAQLPPGSLDRVALVVTASTTVIGWLAVEIVMWSRLRIPAYDLDHEVGVAPAASKVGV